MSRASAQVARPLLSDRQPARWESWLDRASEWVNPILVKESRQALKSRQFLVTFTMLLSCCWLWSLLGVALRSPGIFYVPGGRFMLIGYFLILTFPLVIIIPFAAFRSLAAELEDGTFELLAISTLKPRQVVTGKLGSASLQILIYVSVLLPCMAFTYLLRGVDILFILSIVFYGVLLCLLLCSLGLLLGTLTKARHWQILLSVIFILALGGLCLWISVGVSIMIGQNVAIPFEQVEYWYAQGVAVTATTAISIMCLLAAAARIGTRSENQSTAVRVGLVICHMLILGWVSRYCFQFEEIEIGAAYVVLATILWMLTGSMMTGEDVLLSPRVRRGLPQTSLGRLFLTLFFPGPGSGYLFVTANMLTVVLASAVLVVSLEGLSWSRDSLTLVSAAWVCAAYVVAYVGVNRLLLRAISRRTLVGPVSGFLTCFALCVLGVLVPIICQFSLSQYLNDAEDYTLLQLPNMFWTIYEVVDGNTFANQWGIHPLSLIVSVAALAIFVLNLCVLPIELHQRRSLTPQRVLEEDAVLQPVASTAVGPSNPWDEPA